MCQVHTGAYVSPLAPRKPKIPLATQERLPRIYCTYSSTYHYAYARQTQVNWKQETKKKEKEKGKERKGKKRKESEKGKERYTRG